MRAVHHEPWPLSTAHRRRKISRRNSSSSVERSSPDGKPTERQEIFEHHKTEEREVDAFGRSHCSTFRGRTQIPSTERAVFDLLQLVSRRLRTGRRRQRFQDRRRSLAISAVQNVRLLLLLTVLVVSSSALSAGSSRRTVSLATPWASRVTEPKLFVTVSSLSSPVRHSENSHISNRTTNVLLSV